MEEAEIVTQRPRANARPNAGGWRSPAGLLGLAIAAVVLVATVAALVVFGRRRPPSTVERPATVPVAVVLSGPAVEASAADMLVRFKDEPAEAERLYKGRVVDVTGTVFQKNVNLAGEQALTLEGGSQARFGGVRCVFPAANHFQLNGVAIGEHVAIRGRCEGLVSDVVLRDCAVLKSGD